MTDNEILPAQMPKAFDPKAIEAGWYARWEADRLFVADAASDRESFDARVNSWYESVGATIINQLRLLGASMDWTRLRFTMDSRYYRSVMTAFVAFYERGWIYRAPRIVNWCPHDRSAISDLEV